MKKIVSIILVLALSVIMVAGCSTQKENETVVSESGIINPLPETIDINNLDNCTVAVSLEKGDAYVDDSGKMMMKVKVYTYELYDMVDIATLKVDDEIIRNDEYVKVTEIERLDSGLVRINGGELGGGFELISNDSNVYYEIGMNDVKSYNEIGEVTLPVSTEFIYTDVSDIENGAKEFYPGDFLVEEDLFEYNFNPNNTSIVIENGVIVKMNKVYMP